MHLRMQPQKKKMVYIRVIFGNGVSFADSILNSHACRKWHGRFIILRSLFLVNVQNCKSEFNLFCTGREHFCKNVTLIGFFLKHCLFLIRS